LGVEVDADQGRLDVSDAFGDDVKCPNQGDARLPVLSPQGGKLVFYAAPGAARMSGRSRLDVAGGLYAIDLTKSGSQAKLIASGITAPRNVSISPDGSKVALTTDKNGTGEVSIVNLLSGARKVVGIGDYSTLSFSPDGKQLVVAFYPPGATAMELRLLSV
jgi:DNA-binding beta-propeller fold protein YncE